jgi:hypothetical protein
MDPRAAVAAPVEQSMVSSAIYRDGHRIDSPPTLAATYQRLREQPDAMAWIGLYRLCRCRRRGAQDASAGAPSERLRGALGRRGTP